MYDPFGPIPPELCEACRKSWVQWRFYASPEVKRGELATYKADAGLAKQRDLETIKSQHEVILAICTRHHSSTEPATS